MKIASKIQKRANPTAPRLCGTSKNPTAVASSIKGYLREIFLLQLRHLPIRTKYEKSGILSNQEISFLHFGHLDLPPIDSPRGRRQTNTFTNDPNTKPKTKINTKSIFYGQVKPAILAEALPSLEHHTQSGVAGVALIYFFDFN